MINRENGFILLIYGVMKEDLPEILMETRRKRGNKSLGEDHLRAQFLKHSSCKA